MNQPQTTTEKYYIVLSEIYRESKKRHKRPISPIIRSLRSSSTILPALVSHGYLSPTKGSFSNDWKWLGAEPTIQDAELIRVTANKMVNGDRNKTPHTRRAKLVKQPITSNGVIEQTKPIAQPVTPKNTLTNHPTWQRVSIFWGLFTWERK
jgi:hypothetical protein